MNITGSKYPNGLRQTSCLFASTAEELKWGLLRNNSSLVVISGLESTVSGFQVHTLPHGHTASTKRRLKHHKTLLHFDKLIDKDKRNLVWGKYMYIFLDILLCSITWYFYELCCAVKILSHTTQQNVL